mmetsp:Transcript_49918/g.109010  ORF Transcript_49918/g.109010 Transcript_49918/m.109010 type:complete len:436 (-) Transcript_49918:173-1480(-)
MPGVKLIKGTRYWAAFEDGFREAVFVGKDASGCIALAVLHEDGQLTVSSVDGTEELPIEFRVVQPEHQDLLRESCVALPPKCVFQFPSEPDFNVLKQLLTVDALPVDSDGGYVFSRLLCPDDTPQKISQSQTADSDAGAVDAPVVEDASPIVLEKAADASTTEVSLGARVECHSMASDSDEEDRPAFPRMGQRPSGPSRPLVGDPLGEAADVPAAAVPRLKQDEPVVQAKGSEATIPVPVRSVWTRNSEEGGANPQSPQPDMRHTADPADDDTCLEGKVLLQNKSRSQVKVCLYRGNDVLQWVPYGGVRGSGVRFIDPEESSTFEVPPGEYCVKIFRPGLIDVPLYTLEAQPGASVVFTGEPEHDTDRGAVATTAVVAGATGLLLAGPVVAVGALGSAVYVGTRQDGAGAALRAVGKVGTAVGAGFASFAQRLHR